MGCDNKIAPLLAIVCASAQPTYRSAPDTILNGKTSPVSCLISIVSFPNNHKYLLKDSTPINKSDSASLDHCDDSGQVVPSFNVQAAATNALENEQTK